MAKIVPTDHSEHVLAIDGPNSFYNVRISASKETEGRALFRILNSLDKGSKKISLSHQAFYMPEEGILATRDQDISVRLDPKDFRTMVAEAIPDCGTDKLFEEQVGSATSGVYVCVYCDRNDRDAIYLDGLEFALVIGRDIFVGKPPAAKVLTASAVKESFKHLGDGESKPTFQCGETKWAEKTYPPVDCALNTIIDKWKKYLEVREALKIYYQW